MSRRKFNLGDILRKLNEENQAQQDTASQEKKGERQPGRSSDETSPSVTPGVSSRSFPASELPGQPVIGRMRNERDVSFSEKKHPFPPARREIQKETPLRQTRTPPPGQIPQTETENPESRVSRDTAASPLPSQFKPLSAGDDDEEEGLFDVYKYIGIFMRRRYIIALVTLCATLLSLFRYFRSDPYYIANARLLFRPDNQEIISDQRIFRYWGDREKILNTHLELLKSQTVLNSVATNLSNAVIPAELRNGLQIEQGETEGEKNDIIELTFRNVDAETARDVVNELCRSYIEYRRDVNAQEITRLVGKFEFQIDKLQKELDEKESKLREFKEANRMVELSNETNVTIEKLAAIEMELQQTQLALLESKERFTALKSQIGKQELNVVQSVTYQDPFQSRIADLELELNTLNSEYSPEHYKVRMIRQQIENLKAVTADSITREAASRTLVKNPIRQALLQELVNLTVEKSALDAKRMAQEQLIERLNRELIQLPALEQEYAFLQRETESLLQTLRMLKTKYEEAKIRRDSEESDLKILELAQLPRVKHSSISVRDVIIGIVVGLLLGIILAFLVEFLDQTLKDPSTVESVLGLPLLGIVPFIEADNALLEKATELTKNILEPFRALRANLKHIMTTHNLQTFIVCSAVKGEGKTTLAVNLGITFALDGKKVILVDGDLRRSQVHSLFAIPKEKGLSDFLLDTVTIDEIVKPTKFENLFVITSGERPHNPAELLGTMRFDLLTREIRSKADIIIFDSPALLPVSDTITMAPKIDGVLFVVRTFWSPIKAAKQALNQLQRIGSQLYGGILNGASHSGKYYPYYYGYYGYYGYYSYKYSYDDDHKRKFSFRRLGLSIEQGAKEKLTSFRYTVPKHADRFSRTAGGLLRKKVFWLLLGTFLFLSGTRLAVRELGPVTVQDPVVYLGIGGGASTGGGGNQAVSEAGTEDIAFQHSPLHNSDSAGGSDGRNGIANGLSDSVRSWFAAFSEADTERYLAFYDQLYFRFNGGGFEEWEQQVRAGFINRDTSERLEVTSIDHSSGVGSAKREVLVGYRSVDSADTSRFRTMTVWKSSADGWRITEQELPVAFTGEAEAD